MAAKRNNTIKSSIPLHVIAGSEWGAFSKRQPKTALQWAESHGFVAEAGSICVIADAAGDIAEVWVGVSDKPDTWSIAGLPSRLPAGNYTLKTLPAHADKDSLYLGWLLGSYRFTRYKKRDRDLATLDMPDSFVQAQAAAINNARDLINTPANDMGPEELAGAAKKVAKAHKAIYSEIVGEDLLAQNYPAIYEVGKASTRAPRLIDIRWGNPKAPKVTLVGKGVCFDSGGLDIKPSSGMKLMKKDMGGAAAVLALAHMIMQAGLPVRLRVLIPAVENSISGNAYRPMDIIKTRKGMSVEVGNTDAEGRLILCDALFEADQEKPDLLIDCATLTGAARTALGTDIPAMFTHDDALASDIMRHSNEQNDPVWRLPLWAGYRDMLKSPIADINSAPDSGYAGAITAALYLNEFVKPTRSWIHIDMMAWNLSERPGRPQGGEAMAVRALYAMIKEKFTSGFTSATQNTGSQRKKSVV